MSPATGGPRPNKRRLWIALILAATYLAAEVVGGLLTHSLALLADAGHMLTDVGGLALALTAIWFAEKPATAERTYGYHRAEILAALANGVVLIGISLFILFEAYRRFRQPSRSRGRRDDAGAGVGLIVNVVGMFILKSGAESSLNVKGAYFEACLTCCRLSASSSPRWSSGGRDGCTLIPSSLPESACSSCPEPGS